MMLTGDRLPPRRRCAGGSSMRSRTASRQRGQPVRRSRPSRYARVAMPQTKMSANDFATSLTEK